MGRYGRRISRSLIGVLIVTLVLGLAFYLKNTKTTHAEEAAAAPAAPSKPAQPPAAKPSDAKPPTPAAAPPATQSQWIEPKPDISMTVTPTTQPQQYAAAIPAPAAPQVTPATRPAPAPPQTVNPMTAAQTKQEAGDLLGARKILNEALFSGKLASADSERARQILSEINKTVVFSAKRFADDEFGGTYSVQSGDLLTKIASKYEVTWEALARLNSLSDPKKLRAGATIKVIHGPFNAVVYKSRFMMDIYLGPPLEKGSMYITSYPVGLGKDDSTPTGAWLVEVGKKIKNPTYYSPRGEGVIAADDPKNPLGERWVGLTGIDGHAIGKASYGIHGTIDESSVGKMESMGCIRMKNDDVEWVFDLMVEGKSMVLVKE